MKAFLSHTSSDKDLVGLVHKKLAKEDAWYDATVACEYDIYKYCLRFAKYNFFYSLLDTSRLLPAPCPDEGRLYKIR